jgi:hypothetical protein
MTTLKSGVVLVAAMAVLLFVGTAFGTSKGAGSTPGAAAAGGFSGVFGSWTPVDAGHGYARFAVTNHGTTSATAKCTVEVRDDFGNLGWDSLVGETIPAGQTKTLRMAISFEGALRVTKGTVKDC